MPPTLAEMGLRKTELGVESCRLFLFSGRPKKNMYKAKRSNASQTDTQTVTDAYIQIIQIQTHIDTDIQIQTYIYTDTYEYIHTDTGTNRYMYTDTGTYRYM